MTTEIYVTPAEQSLVDSLSPALRIGWNIQPETYDRYETPRQIQMRYFLADLTTYPEVKAVVQKMQTEPEKVSMADFLDFSPQIQENVYFLLGAIGLTQFISLLLQEEIDDEAMFALSVLTTARHKLLKINQSATHV